MLTDELERDNAALQERVRELEEKSRRLILSDAYARSERDCFERENKQLSEANWNLQQKEERLLNRIRELESEVERTPGTRIKCLKQNALLSRSLEALKAAEWNKALSEHCYLIFVCQQCGNSKASGHAADCLIGNAIAEIEKFMEVSGE